MAIDMTRGPAAPMPWITRAATISSMVGAVQASTAPRIYRAAPRKTMLLRPNVSDSGPLNRVPSPIPTMKADRISCARFGLSGTSSAAMSGIAGSMLSMEKATVATIMAIMATNSNGEILDCIRRSGLRDTGC